MISSEDAINYDDLTEQTNKLLNYIIEPSIKKCAVSGKCSTKILMFGGFINLSMCEQIFCTDRNLMNTYFSEYESCYSHNLMFTGNNKNIIKNRLNFEISSLGYNVVFQDIKHDKINDGFSIVIAWLK